MASGYSNVSGMGGRDGPKIPTQSAVKEIKRKVSNAGERAELELNVAGTEFAELERSVFKATKVNFKVPKEKHVQRIFRAIDDPNSSRITLRILARRLREANQTVTVMKTLIVWHRCLRSGDSAFTELCAPYANSILSLNNFNDKALPDLANFSKSYAKYLKQKLHTFEKTKYEYDKESEWGDSRTKGLELEPLLDEMPHLLKLVELLFQCEFVRAPNLPLSFSMAFELLIRDVAVLCRSIEQGIIKLLSYWDEMKDYDMLKAIQSYRQYATHLKEGCAWLEVLDHYSQQSFEGVSGQISSSKVMTNLKAQQDKMNDSTEPRCIETLEAQYEQVRLRKKAENDGLSPVPAPVPAKPPPQQPPPSIDDDFDPRQGAAESAPPPVPAAAKPDQMLDLLSLDDPVPVSRRPPRRLSCLLAPRSCRSPAGRSPRCPAWARLAWAHPAWARLGWVAARCHSFRVDRRLQYQGCPCRGCSRT